MPEDVVAYFSTGDTFPTLGVPPLLGRNLGPSDSPRGQEPQPVIMLNYRFWQRHFNGDRAVIGRTSNFPKKRSSKAIGSVAMEAMFLLEMGSDIQRAETLRRFGSPLADVRFLVLENLVRAASQLKPMP